MIPSRAIARKRDGEVLEPDELRGFLRGYLTGEVCDAQMSALLMAVHFRGLVDGELATLVDAMVSSGRTLDFSHLPGPVVDKHSTGGVGDKVSLALVPLAAELGLFVPMMAGRGLGHTGGTLDKLEAIPGFRTELGLDAFRRTVEEVGGAVMGQSEEIAPLDRRLYALRDVTATVPSIPLIAASIMSKKLAEGLSGLVLDVKLGVGAFIPEPQRARELAGTMVAIGAARGLETRAVLTAMDRPLGRAVGNALEVEEAVACLRGEGPPDLTEVVASLAGEMLAMGGLSGTPEEGRDRALDALEG
ncbi:MAG: thymidine phosphorylase, partial [Gemmatimonadetes bacterium]|nr:thymidine phosphorylase [Gemmatimonadota bacterium]NIR80101.1 thymidine phosphorylase [Gemmatimonadota bacterium]NIT88856.1 thymidine phosphorylase [Gemmatimonadota bacterium]NIU32656.1 thymidine phosphorylase [Gemmatimonadota bacterium]NIU37096.1 thymidine phosphorylase [Gemmatimonadota bacterium]